MTRDRGSQHHHQRRKFVVPQSAVDSNEEDDPEEKFPSERKLKGKYRAAAGWETAPPTRFLH
jgi:hypothetical protein